MSRVICLCREREDYTREVMDWVRDFRHFGGEVEVMDPDSREGEMFVRARGIVEYPCVVVVAEGGEVLFMRSGLPMPRFDEVRYWGISG